MNDKFKFYIPAEIAKATDASGHAEMRFKGIASTSNRDSQGEYLDPSGFDLSSFRWVNWNHKAKDDPSTIIGEPDNAKCKVTPRNELYIEGILYPQVEAAKATYQLMKALSESPTGNKLALSVEGKVMERDPKNPKRILKSKITGVAICPVPVNGDTWVDLITKGFTSEMDKEEYDEETKKVIGNSLMENQNKKNVKNLTKSEIYDKIFSHYPSIEIEKAKSVYSLIEKLSTMENKEAKTVSDETITKAFEILDLASAEISKASKNDDGAKPTAKKANEAGDTEGDEDAEVVSIAKKTAKELKKGGMSAEEVKAKMIKKGYSESTVEKATKDMDSDKDDDDKDEIKKDMKKSFSELTDLLKAQSDSFDAKFKAVGEIMKAQTEENEELKKSITDLMAQNEELKNDVEKALSQPQPRKSMVRSYSEKFEKSQDGKAIYNINSAADRKALKTKLEDLSGINKGEDYDKSLMKIAQDLELTKGILPQDLQRLETFDIKVVVG